MQDLELLRKCEHCNHNLTLMESVRLDSTNQLCLVIRCLHCGKHPVEEVAELYDKVTGFLQY